MLVINEPTSSCCGKPTGQCSCGGNKGKKPTPLPVFNYQKEFEASAPKKREPEQTDQSVLNYGGRSAASNGQKPTPLGYPSMTFEAPTKQRS